MYFHFLVNEATVHVSQHIWCLSQARINWEGSINHSFEFGNQWLD